MCEAKKDQVINIKNSEPQRENGKMKGKNSFKNEGGAEVLWMKKNR
jgi:hypothetical protein